jgi:hypothetical protein
MSISFAEVAASSGRERKKKLRRDKGEKEKGRWTCKTTILFIQ